MAISAKTTGWISIGFDPEDSMMDADVILGWVENGAVHPARKNRVIQNHFSLKDVKDFLREIDKSQLKEVHLLHLSDENSDAERFKREIQELVGAPVVVAGK